MKKRIRHDRLRRELSKKNLSQNGWALRLGLERGHLSKLVHGKRPYPNARTRRKLLDGLCLPFEALFQTETRPQRARQGRVPQPASNRLLRFERKQLQITIPWIRPVGRKRQREGIMQNLLQDLRFGWRSFARRPGLVLMSALVLALGIGANTGIFSFVEALLLRPPDISEPHRVVRVFVSPYRTMSHPNFLELRDGAQSFTALSAHQQASLNFGVGEGGVEPIQGEVVSGNYFQMMGVKALVGRTLLPQDDITPGAHPVVVLSHRLWQRRLDGDPAAVGQPVFINGHRFIVAGVAPEGFQGSHEAYPTELWAPTMMYQQVRPRGARITSRGWGWLLATGRLKPGVTLDQAQGELERLASALQQSHPRMNAGLEFQVLQAGRFPESFEQGLTGVMGFLMAVVGLVLLVACGNVASMLLARTAQRRREIAVRLSLGARRGRLLRQWLTESLLLSLLGAVGGVLVAVWVRSALEGLRPPQFQNFAAGAQLDAPVLGFALLLSFLTAFLFGILPAWRATGEGISGTLRDEATSSSTGRRGNRLLNTFVIGQVAVSALLLVASGLLLRSLQQSAAFDPGFESNRLLLSEINLRLNGYSPAQADSFFRRLKERLTLRPEVHSAAYATSVPLGLGWDSRQLVIPGQQPPEGRSGFSMGFNQVSPGYFKTMGIQVLLGRSFADLSASEIPSGAGSQAPIPIVINRTMASQFWPDASPVGQRVRDGGNGPWAEIIGVAADIQYRSLGEDPQPYVYLPSMGSSLVRTLHLRSQGDPQLLKPIVQQEIDGLDAQVAPRNLLTMAEMRALPLFPSRAMAAVSAVFGVLTLLLTAVGLYGLLSYTVSQRTFEIGVRMALGADSRRVWLRVTAQGMRLAVLGLAAGLLGGWGAAQLLSGLLFGVGSADPATYAVVSLTLLTAALLACALPAHLASRVDPLRALRCE